MTDRPVITPEECGDWCLFWIVSALLFIVLGLVYLAVKFWRWA